MKPYVLITRPVSPTAIELLTSVCDILPRIELPERRRADNRLVAASAHALLLATPDRIDDIVLHDFPVLRVIACTFRLPEHIDIATLCTRCNTQFFSYRRATKTGNGVTGRNGSIIGLPEQSAAGV